MSNNSKHDEHTRLISLKPGIIGLEGIILSTSEANIFKNGRVVSQPDNLLFDPSTHTVYNIEYKCHDNNSQARHAEYQLKRAERLMKEVFTDYRVVNLYVHDDYKIEVAK